MDEAEVPERDGLTRGLADAPAQREAPREARGCCGEPPREALAREVREECGLEASVGDVLTVHDEHFSGTAPSGRFEDFHAVLLVFEATVPDGAEPRLAEQDGTTDAVAWVPVAAVESGEHPVLDVVTEALRAAERRRPRTG